MKTLNRAVFIGITVAFFMQSSPLLAQQLEEIIVTAQRREQSLQEVPISLETISGAQLVQQGFREMDDLSNFIPTVEIDWTMQEQDISIRGYGTVGANLSADQAAPTFVDGIHYSRGSMIRSALMDVERIEILRGPQPVFFGQNATVGAFSVVTRKPGPEWEGNITGEIGNYGRLSFEGGIGGPISDTLGIRVSGKFDTLDGYMTDIVSREKFPKRTDGIGRVIVQWVPMNNLEVSVKAETAILDGSPNGGALCLTGSGDTGGSPEDTLIPGTTAFETFEEERAQVFIDDNCFSENGTSQTPPFLAPISGITTRDGGIVDMREAVRRIRAEDEFRTERNLGPLSWDDAVTSNFYMDLNYQLGNGIELNSLTGYIDYDRSYDRENGLSASLMINERMRSQRLDSFSQEFRVSSPVGGMIEWMVGLYYQDEDLDIVSDNLVADIRRPNRHNEAWQDSEWKSVFATVTFNFMDGKASIDLGGRYTDVDKTGFLQGYGATWIYDIDPTPGTPGGGCVEGVNAEFCFEDDSDVIDLGNGMWTHAWRTEKIASVWDTQSPVGMTEPDPCIRRDVRDGCLPHLASLSNDDFNPQITLRYRPSEDLSLYAKWAQAFKAGGFETGVSSLPDFDSEFSFKPEFSENWEIGAKGTFLDGRARGSVSAFWMEVEDLQIETTVLPEPGESSAPTPTVNAGLQRVRGSEFNFTMAVTDQLSASLSGAFMDGKMVEFEGAGCTPAEFLVADTGPCISEEESAEILGLNVGDDGADELAGFIDRSGSKAPRSPDWKFALNVDYWMPVAGNYKAILNNNFAYSDGYMDNVEEFDNIINWGTHANWNLTLGFGDMEDTWRVSAWVRNILEAQPQYNAEFDVESEGFVRKILGLNDFRTYGLQLEYNYN